MMMILKLDPWMTSWSLMTPEVGPRVAGPRLRMSRTSSGRKSRTGSYGQLTLAVAWAGTAGGLLTVAVLAVPGAPDGVLAMNLHVLPEAGRVGVGLVASPHLAVVRLVRGVHVRVLLSVARVGKASITSVKLALERFLTWKKGNKLEI